MNDLEKLKKDSIIKEGNGFYQEVNSLKSAIILSFEKHTLYKDIIYFRGEEAIKFVS